jgi:hypothetical protein
MYLILIAISGLAATVQPPSQEPAQDEPIVVPSQDRMICRNEIRTNSRFARRTCVAASARTAQGDNHRREAGEMIDRAMINNVEVPCPAAQTHGPLANC